MRLRFTEAPPAARESKPRWSDVPASAVHALERYLGASVTEAEIAWGGYSPSASFHLTLADGRHAFAKGTHPGQTREGRLSLAQEIESYRALPVLKGLAPDYLGAIEIDDWSFLLLEAIEGARKALPWSRPRLERLAQSLAAFYERARGLAMTWQRPNAYRSLAIDLTDLDTGWIALAGC